jgi:hypothetical protein
MRTLRIGLALLLIAGCRTSPPAERATPVPLEIAPLPSSSVSVAQIASSGPAETRPPTLDARRAEELFQEGRLAAQNDDLATARDKFAESYHLDPATGTLLHLANTEERLGDIRSARRHFQEIIARANGNGRAAGAARIAQQRLDALPK